MAKKKKKKSINIQKGQSQTLLTSTDRFSTQLEVKLLFNKGRRQTVSLLPTFYWTLRRDIFINPDKVGGVIKTAEDLKGACASAILQRKEWLMNCLRESPATVWNVYPAAFLYPVQDK